MDISLRTELEQFIVSWNLSGEVDEELRNTMEDEYKDFISVCPVIISGRIQNSIFRFHQGSLLLATSGLTIRIDTIILKS